MISSSASGHLAVGLPQEEYDEKKGNLRRFFSVGNLSYIERKIKEDQIPHERILANEFVGFMNADRRNMCELFHLYAEDNGLRTNGIPAFLPIALSLIDDTSCEAKSRDAQEFFDELKIVARLAQEAFYLAVKCVEDIRHGARKNPVLQKDADKIKTLLYYAADNFAEAAVRHDDKGSPYDGMTPTKCTGSKVYNDGSAHAEFSPAVYVLEHFGKQSRSKGSLIARIEQIVANSRAASVRQKSQSLSGDGFQFELGL